jgi:hypothetical protein
MPREAKRRPGSAPSEQPRVTMQSLLVGDYIQLNKACELLGGVDWHTLRGWIDALHIKTYAHPTDARLVLLRSTDVEKLAKISDRPFHLPEKQRTRKSSRAVLESQLADLREQYEQTVKEYERQLVELQDQHRQEMERLQQRIHDLEHPVAQ